MTNTSTTLNLLLIDDDPDDMFLFEEAVKQSPVNIKLSIGEPAAFYKQIEAQQPDVVLLDINMPVKDGLEFLRELRADNQYKNLPVIMYSTSRYKIGDSFTAGANKYYVKPNTFDDLKKLVKLIDEKAWEVTSTSENDNFFVDYSTF